MGDFVTDTNFDAFIAQVVAGHEDLPPQLQKIAQFVLDNPQRVALMTIADLSEEIGVPPSGVIRFSKALGYSGFSEIQKILKNQLGDLIPSSYYARLENGSGDSQMGRCLALAETSMTSLPDVDAIRAAAITLSEARLIHVVGMRRAFGVASYLTYLLSGFEAPVIQHTALGDMKDAEMLTLSKKDVLVAVSFPSYRPETRSVVSAARSRGTRVIAITDSQLSPIARGAAHTLLCDQATDAGFRSVVGSMITGQALALEYGEIKRA